MIRTLDNITTFIQIRLKFLILLGCVLFLTACENDECPTVQDYINSGIQSKCLICGLFEVLTKAATKAANDSWRIFAKQLVPVVAMATALYVAMFSLKSLGAFSKQNAFDFLTGDKKGVMVLLFKTAFIILLLQNQFLIDKIIYPILLAGLHIGATLSVTDAPEMGAGGAGWAAIFKVVNEYAKAFNDNSYTTVAIGEAMICNATNVGWLGIFAWEWLMLFYGLILYIFGWILLVGISFYIVDIIINLTFGAVLLPFGIAFSVSKLTSSYSKNVWNVFMFTFFSFVMMGIMVGLAIQLVKLGMTGSMSTADIGMNGAIKSEIGITEGGAAAAGGSALNTFLSDFSTKINGNMIKEISKELWKSGSLLLTIVCMCVIVQMTMQMKKLASSLSEGGTFTSAGSETAGAFGSTTGHAAKKLGNETLHLTGSGVKYAGHVASRITRLDKLSQNVGDKWSRGVGKAFGVGKHGGNAWWR